MISLYGRIATVAALLVALAAGAWKCYTAGQNSIRAEWTAEKLATSEAARMREQAAQRTNERIDHAYQTTKSRLAADKRITDDRLREFAAASADTATQPSCGTDDPHRAIARECTAALGILDDYAKGVAGKAAALQSYAANVCLN